MRRRFPVGGFPAPHVDTGHVRLIDSWAVGQDTICVVYEGWWFPGWLGLRRRIEPQLPVWQEVENILDGELGEPVGRMVEGVTPDENDTTWWEGDRPEWRRYE